MGLNGAVNCSPARYINVHPARVLEILASSSLSFLATVGWHIPRNDNTIQLVMDHISFY